MPPSVRTVSTMKLDPDAVRRRALSIDDCTELPTYSSRPGVPSSSSSYIVSFLRGERSRDIDQLARIAVFCDTGTVGITRFLLQQHQMIPRQTFRRNVNSLDVVERLLRHPPSLTKIDSNLIGFADNYDNKSNQHRQRVNGTHSQTPENENITDNINEQMELLTVGLAILQGERDKLQSHLSDLEQHYNHSQRTNTLANPSTIHHPHHQNGSKEDLTTPKATPPAAPMLPVQGMEFQFSLPPAAMQHVDQCLQDINMMGRLIRGVATNGKGSVFLYGNGGVAYTPNIPRGLYHKLSQLRHAKTGMNSRPSYVSLGTRDRYFVSFHDGSWSHKGPKGLDRELKKTTQPPLSVAFGSSYDTFFIVFHDGSWSYQGREIPEELEKKLNQREERPDLVCVNLGPSGEWFLKTRNGRIWWGGVSEDMDDTMQQLIQAGHTLRFLDFGEDESYSISYD